MSTDVHLVPPHAVIEWRALAGALEDVGTVPCRVSDAEAWWPDRKHLDAAATRTAVHGCWRCPAREACAAYALAADERPPAAHRAASRPTLPRRGRRLSRLGSAR